MLIQEHIVLGQDGLGLDLVSVLVFLTTLVWTLQNKETKSNLRHWKVDKTLVALREADM